MSSEIAKGRKKQILMSHYMKRSPAPMLSHSQLIDKYLAKLNHTTFREDQENIITAALQKKNVFISKPTGSGKSLCYQIPILVLNELLKQKGKNLPGIGVVICPLISLMEDQVLKLKHCGISAEYVNTSDPSKKKYITKEIMNGNIDIIYITPESFLSLSKHNKISQCIQQHRTITTFVVDEAHCVLMWGTQFRPLYFRLAEIMNNFKQAPIIACTATVNKSDMHVIKQNLRCKTEWQTYSASVNRQNIEMNIKIVEDRHIAFNKAVRNVIDIHKRYNLNVNSVIIFAGTKPTAHKFKTYIDANNVSYINARIYHSGIGDKEKENVLKGFQNGNINVVICTSAFGMGIDKQNVRCVIHLAMPPSIENYCQQFGRAGRDGLQSHAYLYTYDKDRYARSCLRNICSQSVLNIARFLFKKYKVNKEENIGTATKIYNAMKEMTDKCAPPSNWGTSLKILQRFGIIHKAGGYIYLLSKEGSKIDVNEIKQTATKSEKHIEKMRELVLSKSCLRVALLRHFGEYYECKLPFCCSNCIIDLT